MLRCGSNANLVQDPDVGYEDPDPAPDGILSTASDTAATIASFVKKRDNEVAGVMDSGKSENSPNDADVGKLADAEVDVNAKLAAQARIKMAAEAKASVEKALADVKAADLKALRDESTEDERAEMAFVKDERKDMATEADSDEAAQHAEVTAVQIDALADQDEKIARLKMAAKAKEDEAVHHVEAATAEVDEKQRISRFRMAADAKSSGRALADMALEQAHQTTTRDGLNDPQSSFSESIELFTEADFVPPEHASLIEEEGDSVHFHLPTSKESPPQESGVSKPFSSLKAGTLVLVLFYCPHNGEEAVVDLNQVAAIFRSFSGIRFGAVNCDVPGQTEFCAEHGVVISKDGLEPLSPQVKGFLKDKTGHLMPRMGTMSDSWWDYGSNAEVNGMKHPLAALVGWAARELKEASGQAIGKCMSICPDCCVALRIKLVLENHGPPLGEICSNREMKHDVFPVYSEYAIKWLCPSQCAYFTSCKAGPEARYTDVDDSKKEKEKLLTEAVEDFKKSLDSSSETSAECKTKSSSEENSGADDNYRGWYDVQGCGKCHDYCRWIGGDGHSGGDPEFMTVNPLSQDGVYWSCRLAGTHGDGTPVGAFQDVGWRHPRCEKEGGIPPAHLGITDRRAGQLQAAHMSKERRRSQSQERVEEDPSNADIPVGIDEKKNSNLDGFHRSWKAGGALVNANNEPPSRHTLPGVDEEEAKRDAEDNLAHIAQENKAPEEEEEGSKNWHHGVPPESYAPFDGDGPNPGPGAVGGLGVDPTPEMESSIMDHQAKRQSEVEVRDLRALKELIAAMTSIKGKRFARKVGTQLSIAKNQLHAAEKSFGLKENVNANSDATRQVNGIQLDIAALKKEDQDWSAENTKEKADLKKMLEVTKGMKGNKIKNLAAQLHKRLQTSHDTESARPSIRTKNNYELIKHNDASSKSQLAVMKRELMGPEVDHDSMVGDVLIAVLLFGGLTAGVLGWTHYYHNAQKDRVILRFGSDLPTDSTSTYYDSAGLCNDDIMDESGRLIDYAR